jgi:dihydroxy-acid dehydratase
MRTDLHSRQMSGDPHLGQNRAMIANAVRGAGFDPAEYFKAHRPIVGLLHTHSELSPCQRGLHGLALVSQRALKDRGTVGLLAEHSSYNDALQMGLPGMYYSLPSRDVTTDGFELSTRLGIDGAIFFVSCDKTLPAAAIAAGRRRDLPSVILHGGPIVPGEWKGRPIDIGDASEAPGRVSAHALSADEARDICDHACPGAGGCGMMATSSTMASVLAALGLLVPSSASTPAEDAAKAGEADQAALYLMGLIERGISAGDIVSRRSLENAVRMVAASGGSTNAILHIPAIAHAFDIPFGLVEIGDILRSTPVLLNVRPLGVYRMLDLHEAGGIPSLIKYMIREGLMHGDPLTVSGRSLEETVSKARDLEFGQGAQDVVLPIGAPLMRRSHISLLQGNIGGCTGKFNAPGVVTGPAICFDSEESATAAVYSGGVKAGQVMVVMYEGPAGGPGMREMLNITSALVGMGLKESVAFVSDGRTSGVAHARAVCVHVEPEAYHGGNIALIEDGDVLTIDPDAGTLMLHVDDAALASRRGAWTRHSRPAESTILRRFRSLVEPPSRGCILRDE